MIIRSLPALRQTDAGDDTLPEVASWPRQDGWPARRVLIRRPWVRAADGRGAADHVVANGRRAA